MLNNLFNLKSNLSEKVQNAAAIREYVTKNVVRTDTISNIRINYADATMHSAAEFLEDMLVVLQKSNINCFNIKVNIKILIVVPKKT
jgi:hypothetical protein